MRHFPVEESDREELERLAPEPWMVEQLKLNPSYVSWGPHEDYMWKKGEDWDTPVIAKSWSEFGPWSLDDLNEVAHFYFSVERPSRDCETCGGNGMHPDAQWISESFYEHSSPFRSEEADTQYQQTKRFMEQSFGCRFNREIIRRRSLPPVELLNKYGQAFAECCVRIMENNGHWSNDITEDEASALVGEGRGRLDQLLTAADFNRAENRRGLCGHDAINRWILIKQRLKRLGLPQSCNTCQGHGDLFTGPARLDLTLWVLHPRKGCSRGVEVQAIQKTELPEVYAFLAEAARRNAVRFNSIAALAPEIANA